MKHWFLATVVATLIIGACGGDEVDPAMVIEDYIGAYNGGDIDAVMAVFSEDSVVTGHPFVPEAAGLAAIRALQTQDIESAAVQDAYTISNVEVTGDTVTWDHIWTKRDGVQFCQQGNSAVVKDGKILSWKWSTGGFDCP